MKRSRRTIALRFTSSPHRLDWIREDRLIRRLEVKKRPVTPRQRKFVTACLRTVGPIDRVMQDHQVSPEQLANWCQRPSFRDLLVQIRDRLLRRVRAEVPAPPRDPANWRLEQRAITALVRLAYDLERQERLMRAAAPRPLDSRLWVVTDSNRKQLRLLAILEQVDLDSLGRLPFAPRP